MTDDLKSTLDRELAERTPPLSITGAGIASRGRKRGRARRFGVAGGVTAGVAVLTAGALALAGTGGGTGDGADYPAPGDNAAAAPIEQPEFPLPELDPDVQYLWGSGTWVETDETRRITPVLWDELSAFENLSVYKDSGDGYVPATEENAGAVVRRVERLAVDADQGEADMAGGEVVFERPVYEHTGLAVYEPGASFADDLTVVIYPRGSFEEGAGNSAFKGPSTPDVRHLTAGCEDYEYGAQGSPDGRLADFTCDDSTGPNGQDVLAVDQTLTNPHGRLVWQARTVIVYHLDGTATLISDSVTLFDDHGEQDLEAPEPALSADELAGVVYALPTVTVT